MPIMVSVVSNALWRHTHRIIAVHDLLVLSNRDTQKPKTDVPQIETQLVPEMGYKI
jgi:hypothetical protein